MLTGHYYPTYSYPYFVVTSVYYSVITVVTISNL